MKFSEKDILDFLFCGGFFGIIYVLYIVLWALSS